MKQLSLLILCLFLTCKSFSQIDTPKKNNYVILTEEQASANIKELAAYDGLKRLYAVQERRIDNFKRTISEYEVAASTKNAIIAYKDSIIAVQNKIIKRKSPIEFHSYVGAETFQIQLKNTGVYYKFVVETKKLNFGIRAVYRPNDLYNLPNLYYNLQIEYKIF